MKKYNGKYSLTENLVMGRGMSLLREAGLTGNARSDIGTRAENVIRVHYGLPVTERHSAAGRPDVPVPGIGDVEAKSIAGKGTKYVKIEVFDLVNPPSSADRLAQYLEENPVIYGVDEKGDVYDISGALVGTKSGALSGYGGSRTRKDGTVVDRMAHSYRVDMKSARLVARASSSQGAAMIADLVANTPPKEAAQNHGYPTLGDGNK